MMFGADYANGPLVTGLSLSNSRGLGDYAGITGGQVASAVTGLYPWLGVRTGLPGRLRPRGAQPGASEPQGEDRRAPP